MLAIFMINRFVHDPPYVKNAKAGAFDNLGFALLCLWSGCLQIVLDKGQEDGWFGAVWIRWAVMILGVSLFWFVRHCWKSRDALVDLHVLRNRNFAVGCLLIFMLGFTIYITITILPLFYQEVLGYTALAAGIVVGPRGIGSMIGLPVIGVISHKIDNRYLMCAGFLAFGICTLYFSFVNLEIGPSTLLVPIVITGFALSFVFVPIASTATSTLSNERMGNASCVFNLLRNVGGSIGIATAQTFLVRRTNFHETQIATHLPPTSHLMQQQVHQTSVYLGRHLGTSAGRSAALGLIYRNLERQALLLSFIDVLRWTAVVAFASAVMVWLFQKMTHSKDGSVQLH
jgi:MFS transporter, DHA2 family, multidrug resistance protein